MSWPDFTFPFPADSRYVQKPVRDLTRGTGGLWAQQANRDLQLFLAINHSNEFTAEDFRVWCLDTLHREPPFSNHAWGAIWTAASRSGKIALVGKRIVPVTLYPRRHERQSNIWKKGL